MVDVKGKVRWCFNITNGLDERIRISAAKNRRTISAEIEVLCQKGLEILEVNDG